MPSLIRVAVFVYLSSHSRHSQQPCLQGHTLFIEKWSSDSSNYRENPQYPLRLSTDTEKPGAMPVDMCRQVQDHWWAHMLSPRSLELEGMFQNAFSRSFVLVATPVCQVQFTNLLVISEQCWKAQQPPCLTPCWSCKFHTVHCVFCPSLRHQCYTRVPSTPGPGLQLM